MSAPSGGFFWNWLRQSFRVLHQLWLEVTGFIFICFAVFGAFSLLKEWRAYQPGGGVWKLVASGVFTAAMATFGLYSFIKSRRMQ